MSSLPLDQLGAQAKAHIISGDKAKEKLNSITLQQVSTLKRRT
jgi:hypothetical protein